MERRSASWSDLPGGWPPHSTGEYCAATAGSDRASPSRNGSWAARAVWSRRSSNSDSLLSCAHRRSALGPSSSGCPVESERGCAVESERGCPVESERTPLGSRRTSTDTRECARSHLPAARPRRASSPWVGSSYGRANLAAFASRPGAAPGADASIAASAPDGAAAAALAESGPGVPPGSDASIASTRCPAGQVCSATGPGARFPRTFSWPGCATEVSRRARLIRDGTPIKSGV
jgi:hypothetical protein